jgi:hypothetical protein
MERHGAADHRRKGIVAQDQRMTGSGEMHGDRRSDLVGAEQKRKRLRPVGIRTARISIGHGSAWQGVSHA